MARAARVRRTGFLCAPAESGSAQDRGAVAVEAAIILPVILLLALGMMELGMLMKAHTATTTLAREGARTASAESRVPTFAEDAANSIVRSAATLDFKRMTVWVYLVNPGDDGKPPASCTTNCVNFSGWVDPVGATPGSFTTKSGSWSPSSINACLRDSAAQSVGVYVQTSHDWMFDLFPDKIPSLPGSNTNVSSRTVMKFEPVIPRTDAIEPNLRRCKP